MRFMATKLAIPRYDGVTNEYWIATCKIDY